MKALENVYLAPLTTLKVGGPARYFMEPKSAAEVSEAVNFALASNLPLFVLGGGSNVVISDAGWPGLILKPAILGIDERTEMTMGTRSVEWVRVSNASGASGWLPASELTEVK